METIFIGVICLLVFVLALYFYNKQLNKTAFIPPKPIRSHEDIVRAELLAGLQRQYPEQKFCLDGDHVVSDGGITVTILVGNRTEFPKAISFQINFYTGHKRLPRIIEERLAGIGDSDSAALMYGVESFLNGQFPAILAALNDKYRPDETLDIATDTGVWHWHVMLGDLQQQGALSRQKDEGDFDRSYSVLKPILEARLAHSDQDVHWMRYYVCKQADGSVSGDCYYDNEPDEEALNILKRFASSWTTADFAGQKQFVIVSKSGKMPD